MLIKRDKYLESLKVRMHNGMIKVITGIRRCGKSYLVFEIFKDYLLVNSCRYTKATNTMDWQIT